MGQNVPPKVLKRLRFYPYFKRWKRIREEQRKLRAVIHVAGLPLWNGLSGFGWDTNSKMWIAEPQVWDKLIEARPEAAEWRNKPIVHNEKLAQLFGKDRATGEHVETASEIRSRSASSNASGQNITI